MNVASIIKSALDRLKSVFGRSKGIYKLPFFKTYLALALVLTFIFFIITFPYEMIVRQHLQKFEKKSFRNIFIQDMEINIIGDSFLENIYITFKDGTELTTKQILADLSVNPYSLLFSNSFRGDFQAAGMKYSTPRMILEWNMNGNVDVEFNPRTNTLSDGTIKLMTENVLCKFENMTLPDNMGGFSLPPLVRISSIQLNSEISNNKLTIRQLLVSGNDIRGTVSGTIMMAPIFGNSRLDLTVSIDPESSVLAEFRSLLSSFTDSSGKIVVPVKGTFSRPRASMKGDTGDSKEDVPDIRREILKPENGLPGQTDDEDDLLNMKMN